MITPTRTCPLCLIDYPLEEMARSYCQFCHDRQNRISAAFRRAGKSIVLSELHRPYRYWRQTPQLDTEYALPLAPPRRPVPATWHDTENGAVCAYRRQIEALLPEESAVVNGALVKRGETWQKTIYTVWYREHIFKYRQSEDAARCIYQLTREQEGIAA